MQDGLVEAFHHVPHRCLGRRLRPFTLRHALSLQIAESPFFDPEKEVTREDLVQAVEICSRAGDFFAKGLRPSLLRRALWSLRNRRKLRKRFTGELMAFHAYLGDYCSSPVTYGVKNARSLKVNWVVSNVAALMSQLHMTLEAAWSLSPGEANWLLPAAAERDPWGGESAIVSEREQRIHERIKREEAEEEAAKKADA